MKRSNQSGTTLSATPLVASQILPPNPSRGLLVLTNRNIVPAGGLASDYIIEISLGGDLPADRCIQLYPGEKMTMDYVRPEDSVWAKSSLASAKIAWVE